MLSFLENIKPKTKFTLPSDTNIVHRYVLFSYSIIFVGQPLFKLPISFCYEARIGWNSIVKKGLEDICHFTDRTFYLKFLQIWLGFSMKMR